MEVDIERDLEGAYKGAFYGKTDSGRLNSLSGGTTWTTFFVVRYPRYLAYVRDAGPRPANFGRPDATNARCTTDFNPTDDERVVDHQAMHLLTATDA